MLVVTRERIDKYDNDIESEDEYKERLLRSFSTDGFSYACNTVYAGKTGTLLFNIASGEYAKMLTPEDSDLEWKEVEKD